jgi:hypothetical protein
MRFLSKVVVCEYLDHDCECDFLDSTSYMGARREILDNSIVLPSVKLRHGTSLR